MEIPTKYGPEVAFGSHREKQDVAANIVFPADFYSGQFYRKFYVVIVNIGPGKKVCSNSFSANS